jgi:hypothetical protein
MIPKSFDREEALRKDKAAIAELFRWAFRPQNIEEQVAWARVRRAKRRYEMAVQRAGKISRDRMERPFSIQRDGDWP